MIKLEIGDEPAELTAQRKICLPLAIAAFNSHGTGTEELAEVLKQGYGVVRPDLYERQHKKCAFCEKLMDKSYMPVEHFRPKGGAEDNVSGKWVMVKTHYWWLAWTWSNLYFSCADCNNQKHKGNRFPIKLNLARMAVPAAPVTYPISDQYYDVSTEESLLLDPRKDNPFNHLEWIPVDRTKPKADWKWTISGRDNRGAMTIDILKLKRRADEVNDHLDAVKALWKQIDGHLVHHRLAEARAAWSDALSTFVDNPKKPYRNAAWCALNSLCDATDRAKYGFDNPAQPTVIYVAPKVP